jgi:hypothetical protein
MSGPRTDGAPKIDPKVKAKWVKALRSGKYQQQRDSVLKNEHGYCCLGVLHRIHTGQDPKLYWNAGICERPEVFDPLEPYIEELTAMNDSKGKSFSEIAAWIEANL